MNVCLATRPQNPLFIPLALLNLKAMLAQRGGYPPEDIALVELPRAADAEEIATAILTTGADVVGLSCYVWNAAALLEAAALVKARRPGVRIVIGGPEVGPVARDVMERHPAIDVTVKSEGEVPLLQTLTAWRASRPLDDVRGLCFRRGTELIDTGDAPLVTDLGDYPSPHLAGYVDCRGRIVCVETQRGCVFRCSFCFYNKDYSLRNRRFDLDRVKEEILFWLSQDIAHLYLMDPIFNLHAARAKEICAFIARHNTRRLPIHAEIWAEFVDDEMARLMSAANVRFLEVGLQTTDTTALATVERRLRLQKFIEGIEHLKRHRLPFELQLIFGLPGETMASFRRSVDFAAALDPPVLSLFHLMVLPGTELWRKAGGMGLVYDPEPPYKVRSHLSMSAAEIDQGRRFVDACNLLQRSKAARVLSREPGLSFSRLADLLVEWQDGVRVGQATDLQAFLAHACHSRSIPPEFYARFAALEARQAAG